MGHDRMEQVMRKWVRYAIEMMQRGERCGLVSVLAVEGSTPREAGTRMVVTQHDVVGTIGGGKLEHQAISQVRLALDRPPGTWRIQDYPLGPLLGQCCGGRVRLLVEHLKPESTDWLSKIEFTRDFVLESHLDEHEIKRHVLKDSQLSANPSIDARGAIPAVGAVFVEHITSRIPRVLMFGAGHVGHAVARVLEVVECELEWFDVRDEYASILGVRIESKQQLVQRAESFDGFTLVMTHDHQLDFDLARASLKSPASFIGLIGSKTKRGRFFNRLAREGFDESAWSRIVCPIGLPQVKGKEPGTIAVAVVAQMLSQFSNQCEHSTKSLP
jgi:xanthine dehydrogenase accessory factor